MLIDIPGYDSLDIRHVLLDYNGTIALDGKIPDSVKERLALLSELAHIHVLTADTHGTAASMCEGLPLEILTFPSSNAAQEKLHILNELEPHCCIAIGNGRNDALMCEAAKLSICIIGPEGACSALLAATDVATTSICDALDLLLKPKRLIATLRG